jgi:hypothetical protein
MRRFRPRLTYANVVASLALFVALGGTTYAAATIGAGDIKKDAVRSKHIKNGEVKSEDLRPALLASLKLHCPSGLLRAADICVEFSLRPAAGWLGAVETCASAQRRLPDAGELALAFDHLGAPQELQWLSTFFGDGSGDSAPLLYEDASRKIHPAFAALGTTFSYRCVTSATN